MESSAVSTSRSFLTRDFTYSYQRASSYRTGSLLHFRPRLLKYLRTPLGATGFFKVPRVLVPTMSTPVIAFVHGIYPFRKDDADPTLASPTLQYGMVVA
jgi:hypothetical protein